MTAVKKQTSQNFILKTKCHITPALPKWPLPQTGATKTHAMLTGTALDDTTLSTSSTHGTFSALPTASKMPHQPVQSPSIKEIAIGFWQSRCSNGTAVRSYS